MPLLQQNLANLYKVVGAESEIAGASPHRLVQMLLEGAINRLHLAKAGLKAKNYAQKGQAIQETMDIIGGLRAGIDSSVEHDLVTNLNDIYSYMLVQLQQAHIDNSEVQLNEVQELLLEIKSGWDGISPDVNQVYDEEQGSESRGQNHE